MQVTEGAWTWPNVGQRHCKASLSYFPGIVKKTGHKPPEWQLWLWVISGRVWSWRRGPCTHISGITKKSFQEEKRKKPLFFSEPTNMGQVFVRTMSSSLNQKEKKENQTSNSTARTRQFLLHGLSLGLLTPYSCLRWWQSPSDVGNTLRSCHYLCKLLQGWAAVMLMWA